MDPAGEGGVLVQSPRRGVSLGAGRFSRSAADELLSAGLASWTSRSGPGSALLLGPEGRSRLKREGAGGAEDGFRAQHGEWVKAEVALPGGTEKATVNVGESPLDWLSRRKDRNGEPLIDPAAREAGERLRRDLTTGGILPGVTSRWEAGPSGSGGWRDPAAATDATVAARQRVRKALDAVGSDLAGLLIDLCGFLKGIEEIERERRWPARSAKVVIRLALWRLAEHYGLAVEARGPDASVRFRSWQAASGLADPPPS